MTVATLCLVVVASSCIVADGGGRPHIVHRPYYRFPTEEDLPQHFQRQHTLVDPVQVYHVGLLELMHLGDVSTCIGDVNLKEVFP